MTPTHNRSREEYILGIWDGHDSGAALIRGDHILYAINEERLSRRKLEVHFPTRSIQHILEKSEITPSEIKQLAISTFDFSKTLTRFFPSMKEDYYLIRRRKKPVSGMNRFKKRIKYKLTEWAPTKFSQMLTIRWVRRALKKLGFKEFELTAVDHHWCHAIAAAACSGFENAAVITLDGIGDALSGTINLWSDRQLKRRGALSGKESLGIFFEHVTNLLNMRELEDEGKVMAMATYAHPVPDTENPMLKWYTVDGLTIHARYDTHRLYKQLQGVLWQVPSEQFAYMAQRTLEKKVVELVRNVLNQFAVDHIALSGGVFNNVLINRSIRNLQEVKGCFIFPHMGDGGLALGAAMSVNAKQNGIGHYSFDTVCLGPSYNDGEFLKALQQYDFPFEKRDNIAKHAAELLHGGEIGLWFQGRMEVGPRALGARSIIANPGSAKIKDTLNLHLKRRVWYQPFCPTMLHSDAENILEDFNRQPDPFMTTAYKVKKDYRDQLRGVIHIDGTCRPQIISEDTPTPPHFRELLKEVENLTGMGVILNTSFNVHGEPLVCSPEDALRTFQDTKADYLVLGDYLIRQK